MDLFEAIYDRRSIRRYEDQPVPEETLETLLRAAMAAPSAGNARPWAFVAVTGREMLGRIPEIHPHAKMAASAAAAVLICGEPGREKYPGNWPQDCAAATQNLLLAAHGSGLGAVWCGVWPNAERMEAFRRLFELPEGIEPHALVCIGHPAEKKTRPDRFEPDRIHRDRW